MNYRERVKVKSLDEQQVAENIERIMLDIASSVLDGHGFAFDVPSRNVGNQLYVPELDRIVLKDKSTIREFASVKHSRKVAIMTRVLQLVYELCVRRIHVTKRDLFYTDVKCSRRRENRMMLWMMYVLVFFVVDDDDD
jgi:meiotic recombination protein SPO11